ncbi:monovalent cation/H+ antiporter subunit D family protein [Desulfuromonas acetoxidans]|uniref:monovalent cation/H+ antiporter subunit D family protein n=1 Tax=Desulfuromonas acetoxidans TaxID=891 RepID=UPI00292F7FE0|nr:monovalent cation/H+ antiporter subunit D family protein [Desulfuromonas acetoxidans]
MTIATLMQLCLIIPAAGALFIVLSHRLRDLREGVTLFSAAALFAVVCQLFRRPDALDASPVILATPLPGLELALDLEPLGLLFAGIASLLWMITSLYTIGYMRGNREQQQTILYACFALALASTMGIALAGNLLTLFVFYEMLTLSTYPLVTHKRDHDALAGGRFYLGILVGSSIGLLLPAIIWTWHLTGTTAFQFGGILPTDTSKTVVTALLLLYAFGIGKAALMPLHRWLPEAMVAPTPVSALLHAVAVVKAGVFCIVKVVLYVFGTEILIGSDGLFILQVIAAFTLLCASLIALQQDNLKRRLAYSTISQLSYITLATAILAPLSITGAVVHIAAHAVGKITLFFAAGAIYTAAHKTRVSELNGIGKRMPWTMGAFAVATLSMIGLPPAAGFLSKWFMLQGAFQSGQLWVIAVLLLSTLLNAGYFIPIVYAAFFKAEDHVPDHAHGEAPLSMVVALSATAGLTLVLFFWPDLIVTIASRLGQGGVL